MIETVLPGTRTKMRILKALYENPGVNLTSLIKKVQGSPNSVLSYVNALVGKGVIKEISQRGQKKVHVRNLYPDFSSEASRLVFSLIELKKKDEFLEKYKNLKPFIDQLSDLLNNSKDFILFYGSYARFSAEKESDLDILIIGDVSKEKKDRLREIFSTLDIEQSIKIETRRQFLANIKKPMYQNILKDHIVVLGVHKFLIFMEGLQ